MLKPHKDPYGYKKLLAYEKAEQLQMECSRLTHLFPFSKTLSSLADQMDRSARSGKQNIVEGWKRNTTREYFDFLGFSIGAIAELEEDCNDIIRGVYSEIIGIMGLTHFTLLEVEKLKFYPLDQNLPLVIQLKLRCKELNFLLAKLQQSLEEKMGNENTLSAKDKFQMIANRKREEKGMERKMLEDFDMIKLENGQVMQRVEWEKNGRKGKLWEWK